MPYVLKYLCFLAMVSVNKIRLSLPKYPHVTVIDLITGRPL